MMPPKHREETATRLARPKGSGKRSAGPARSAPRDLNPVQNRFLKALAHAAKPVVIIGSGGLTAAVMAEIETALARHELIKVRAASAERDLREAWLHEIAATLAASPVAHIGKILVLYRTAEKPRIVLPG